MVLGYSPMIALKMLRKWKAVITSVGQGYESIKSRQDYRTETEITYRGRDIPMNIGKAKENFNKDRKPQCFNYNIYEHMTKKC